MFNQLTKYSKLYKKEIKLDKRDKVKATFLTLRQQLLKREGEPNISIADFVAPRDLILTIIWVVFV